MNEVQYYTCWWNLGPGLTDLTVGLANTLVDPRRNFFSTALLVREIRTNYTHGYDARRPSGISARLGDREVFAGVCLPPDSPPFALVQPMLLRPEAKLAFTLSTPYFMHLALSGERISAAGYRAEDWPFAQTLWTMLRDSVWPAPVPNGERYWHELLALALRLDRLQPDEYAVLAKPFQGLGLLP